MQSLVLLDHFLFVKVLSMQELVSPAAITFLGVLRKSIFFFKRILINTLKYIIQCRYWRFCLRKSSSQSRIPTWRALAPANPMLFCKAASISASSWGRPSLIIPLSRLCRWVTNEFVHHLGNEWPECSRCVCTYPQLW